MNRAEDAERQRLINEAKRIRAEITQIFLDVEYWNNHIRTPFEQPMDPDPDGELTKMARGIDRMLEAERRRSIRRVRLLSK